MRIVFPMKKRYGNTSIKRNWNGGIREIMVSHFLNIEWC